MESEYEEFKVMFPPETKIINITGTPDKFEALLRCRCASKEDFLNWLRQYQELSKNTFRISVTRPRLGKTVLYKAVYRCQHNTNPTSHKRVKKPHKKHTNCPALLRVTVKSSMENRRVRSMDELRGDYPTLVTVIYNHNHTITGAEALKYRDMSEEVKLKLIELFKSHHSPPQALKILKQDLLEEHGDNYFKISADSSLCPDIQTVYNLYYSVCKKEVGEEKPSVQECLKEIVDNVIPITAEARAYYHWMTYGTKVSEEWYNSLLSSTTSVASTSFINKGGTTYENMLDRPNNQNLVKNEPECVPDWCSLQNRWNKLFDKWESEENSMDYYEALQKTVTFFENCKSEAATISALHSVGEQFKARKYDDTIPVQSTSVSRKRARNQVKHVGRKC